MSEPVHADEKMLWMDGFLPKDLQAQMLEDLSHSPGLQEALEAAYRAYQKFEAPASGFVGRGYWTASRAARHAFVEALLQHEFDGVIELLGSGASAAKLAQSVVLGSAEIPHRS